MEIEYLIFLTLTNDDNTYMDIECFNNIIGDALDLDLVSFITNLVVDYCFNDMLCFKF